MEGDLFSFLNLDSEDMQVPPGAFCRGFEAMVPPFMD